MTPRGNNFNYFPDNQLTKFSARFSTVIWRWSYLSFVCTTRNITCTCRLGLITLVKIFLLSPTWLTCASPFRRQVAVAVGWQRDTRCATHQGYDRSVRLCCVGPGHMEQPSHRTADFITVFSDVCEKNSKVIYSAASASEDFCLTGAI